MQINLYPYKDGSESAKALSEAMGIKRIKLENSKFRGSKDKVVINWGSTNISPEVEKCMVVNKPEAVKLASNKLSFFKAIKSYNDKCDFEGSVNIPKFYTNELIAAKFVSVNTPLMARQILNGHSGAGIVFCETIDDVFNAHAELYTQYIPKTAEYRVHVCGGKITDIQRKARRRDIPDEMVDWRVRNHQNGFIYSRDTKKEDLSEQIFRDCIKVIEICGLDFGAVDVVWNKNKGIGYILEVNTAPGLSGQTVDNYTKALQEFALAWANVNVDKVANKIVNNAGVEAWGMPKIQR
jgi:glutathione synthase/RimK-type ligase-like ATP-grasp enzyme